VNVADAEDGALATRAAAGDTAAFGLLMRRHKEPLYRVIRRMTGDAEEAYDVLQESFVAMWRGIGRYDPARPFEAWARSIALNKVRDWARKRAVRRLVAAVIPGLERTAELIRDPAPSPETQAADAQALAAVDSAIAELPMQLREPLVLTVFDGRSQADVAALLGISAKAVETRVRRARQKLADVLPSG
jgi:RNA polymerase sigma factor (sigma-70 family)